MQDILEQPITTRRMIIICALLFLLFVFRALISSNAPALPTFSDIKKQYTQVAKLSEPDLKMAAGTHLMGEKPAPPKLAETATPKPKPKPKPVAEQPKPKKQPLNVKVLGLIASSQQDLNFVILQEGGKKQKSYSPGEKLDDGQTVVKQIDSEKIVFDRDGADEIVYLYKPPTSLNPSAPRQNRQVDPFNDPNLAQPLQYDTPAQIQNTHELLDNQDDAFLEDPFAGDPAANIQYEPAPLSPEQQAEQMLSNGFSQPIDAYTPPVEPTHTGGIPPDETNLGTTGSFNDNANPDFQNNLAPMEGDSSDPFFADSPFSDDVNSNFQ